MLPTISFSLVTSQIDAELRRIEAGGGIVAHVVNDAKSPEGFEYFDSVNSGRRAFGPKRARALRFVGGRDGQTVFARRVRAVPGRWMRELAIPTIEARAGAVLAQNRPLNRESIAHIVNEVAEIASFQIAKRMPRRNGRLAEGYRVERAS
jgi:hypothetical protein